MPRPMRSRLDATLSPSGALEVGATHASPTNPGTGTLPARYRLAGSLGPGGMGEVLLATDTQIDREVAIKRMLIEPTGPAVARFLREAKVQGRLDHPAIVPVYELAHDAEGRPFFVMKRLVGTTLADVLARHTGDVRYTRQKLLRAFADVCLAVELAHSRGVIHRDLKPANIMLGDFGEVYVLDWGIARVLGETDPELRASSGRTTELTQVGAILGTPGYMAPELVRGEPIDQRADVFALGAILFEILAGQAVARAQRSDRGRARRVRAAPVGPRAGPRRTTRARRRLCAAVSPDARDRPTARALAEQIEHFLDGDRDLAQRKTPRRDPPRGRACRGRRDREADRALAMREAGRALALDPTSRAADLLGRLMLEPPKQVPREVEDRLAASRRSVEPHAGDARSCPRTSRASSSLPVVIWIGLHTALGDRPLPQLDGTQRRGLRVRDPQAAAHHRVRHVLRARDQPRARRRHDADLRPGVDRAGHRDRDRDGVRRGYPTARQRRSSASRSPRC